jgi:hypothetical protein
MGLTGGGLVGERLFWSEPNSCVCGHRLLSGGLWVSGSPVTFVQGLWVGARGRSKGRP